MLTRAAGPDNLSRVAQFIPLLAEVEQKVIERFHVGGGLSYSEYPRFHTLMAEQSGEVFDAAVFLPPLIERLAVHSANVLMPALEKPANQMAAVQCVHRST